jgi:transaldolase
MTIDNSPTSADIWIHDRASADDGDRATRGPTRLQRLFVEHGQSPWLDGFSRADLTDGRLSALVTDGVRGVTANPTTFAKGIDGSTEYDEQLAWLAVTGCSVEEAYGELLATDTIAACALLRPVHRASGGMDGFVSVEVAPRLANDTRGTISDARALHQRVDHTNLLVKVPATVQGVPALRALVAQGRNINVTLLFSLRRYAEVIEAYLTGLERFVSRGGDPSRIHGFASFFVGRVDAEVDRQLERRHVSSARVPRGSAGVAQAKLAYQMFEEAFSGPRWERLARHGAHPQLLLWASTAPKDPASRDTRYVEELIGPRTMSTLPERTLNAFEDHGILARTIDTDVQGARETMLSLAEFGIDMDEVGVRLENQGVAGFRRSLDEAMAILDAKRQRIDHA